LENEETNIGELEKAIIHLMDAQQSEQMAPVFSNYGALRAWLIDEVTFLIDRNFEHMLRVLYLIDVNEMKVRRLIQENEGENAAEIIADLILERQSEKVRSRKKYIQKDGKYFSED
jgi:hypothetical protein